MLSNKKVESNPRLKIIPKRMSQDKQIIAPEHTAVKFALWRAVHVEINTNQYVRPLWDGLRAGNAEAFLVAGC